MLPNIVLFEGQDTAGEDGLWETNGTGSGTFEFVPTGADASGLSPSAITVLSGAVLFEGLNSSGDFGLWTTDGIAAGTVELASIAGASSAGIAPTDLTVFGRTEKGRAYGVVTAKALAVLEAILWTFHNAKSGLCYPGYEQIAEAAGCARSTVAEAIKALEDAGIMSWVHRLKRVRLPCADLFGESSGSRIVPQRTSNAYHFTDPGMPAGR